MIDALSATVPRTVTDPFRYLAGSASTWLMLLAPQPASMTVASTRAGSTACFGFNMGASWRSIADYGTPDETARVVVVRQGFGLDAAQGPAILPRHGGGAADDNERG